MAFPLHKTILQTVIPFTITLDLFIALFYLGWDSFRLGKLNGRESYSDNGTSEQWKYLSKLGWCSQEINIKRWGSGNIYISHNEWDFNIGIMFFIVFYSCGILGNMIDFINSAVHLCIVNPDHWVLPDEAPTLSYWRNLNCFFLFCYVTGFLIIMGRRDIPFTVLDPVEHVAFYYWVPYKTMQILIVKLAVHTFTQPPTGFISTPEGGVIPIPSSKVTVKGGGVGPQQGQTGTSPPPPLQEA